MFITVFTSVTHLSPTELARSSPYSTSWMSILILYSHICLGIPTGSFPQALPPKRSTIRAIFPAYITIIDFISRKILGEKYRSLNSSLCSFLYSFVPSYLLGPNSLVNNLLSNTLNLISYFNVSNQVSHT